MAQILLTSTLYANETITSIVFDSNISGINTYTPENSNIPSTLGSGFQFNPTVFELTPNDVFGTWTITYDNGCQQVESVTGNTANCDNVTVTFNDDAPTLNGTIGIFLEGQDVLASGALSANNGFTITSVSPATFGPLDEVSSYQPTLVIPPHVPGDSQQVWTNAGEQLTDCPPFSVDRVVPAWDCTDFALVKMNGGDVDQPVTFSNVPDGISVTVTPSTYDPSVTSYAVTYNVIEAYQVGGSSGEVIFFGLDENGAPIYTLTECDNFTYEIATSRVTCDMLGVGFSGLDADDELTQAVYDLGNGIVQNSLTWNSTVEGPYGEVPTVQSVVNEEGGTTWLLGENRTYTVTFDLTGTGYYNDDVFEGTIDCTIDVTACFDDLNTTFVSTPQS